MQPHLLFRSASRILVRTSAAAAPSPSLSTLLGQGLLFRTLATMADKGNNPRVYFDMSVGAPNGPVEAAGRIVIEVRRPASLTLHLAALHFSFFHSTSHSSS
jgi:hypothetical protein